MRSMKFMLNCVLEFLLSARSTLRINGRSRKLFAEFHDLNHAFNDFLSKRMLHLNDVGANGAQSINAERAFSLNDCGIS
jgi:hypothetical protein